MTNVPYTDGGEGGFPPVVCFYISSALTSIGYAAGAAMLLAVYSKVLEGLDQGSFMGWFTASCSVARIIGPLGASYLLDLDPTARYMFAGVAAMLLLSALLIIGNLGVLKQRDNNDDVDEAARVN